MANIDPAKGLASLLAKTQSRATSGMQFSQGIILEWDTSSFENAVEVSGITLRNLPVLAGTDALTFQPGDVVGLAGWNPNGGFGSWWILGRLVVPGTGAGAATVAWMTSSLAANLAKAIFGEVITADFISATGQTSVEDAWVDLTFGGNPNPGPSITMEVGTSGKAIVFASSTIGVIEFGSGTMSFEGTGPQAIPTATLADAFHSVNLPSGDSVTTTSTGIRLLENLQPGVYTLTAKYRVSNQSLGGGVTFSNRLLLGMPF